QLVDVAPAPVLPGLERADDRVAALVGVRGRMAVRRIVAAADVSALQADPQVQPLAAGGEAIDAAVDRGGQLRDPDVIEVGAGRHVDRPLSQDPLKGSRTRKVVRPGLESSVSEPLWRSTTIRRAVARPRPVPCPTSLVV